MSFFDIQCIQCQKVQALDGSNVCSQACQDARDVREALSPPISPMGAVEPMPVFQITPALKSMADIVATTPVEPGDSQAMFVQALALAVIDSHRG